MNTNKILIFFLYFLFSCNNQSNKEEEIIGGCKIITFSNIDSIGSKKILYFDKNNYKYQEELFIDNGRIRKFKTFYKTKNLETEYTVLDGDIEGKYIGYYDDKKERKKFIVNFIRGNEEGIMFEFYKNGRVFKKSQYKNGVLIGYIYEYNDNSKNSLRCKHHVNSKKLSK